LVCLYLTIIARSCSTAYVHSFTLLIAVITRVFIASVFFARALIDNVVVASAVVACVFITVIIEFVFT
jgi:hypothetical protein